MSNGLEIKGGRVKKAVGAALLNAITPLPYHLRAGRYQWFELETQGCTQTKARPDGGRVIQQSLNGGLPYAYL